MKKGVSAVIGMLVFMVVIIIVFLTFLAFQRSGVYQVSAQVARLRGEVPDVPCFRGPEVDVGDTIYIEPTQEQVQAGLFDINATINASGTASPCFENLTFRWLFGDETMEEKECAYPYTECTIFNHTYNLNKTKVGETLFVSVDVEGMRSGFAGSDSVDVYVADPFLSVANINPINLDNYPCVQLDLKVSGTRGGTLGAAWDSLAKDKFTIVDAHLQQDTQFFMEGIMTPGRYYLSYKAMKYQAGRLVPESTAEVSHKLSVKVRPTYQNALLEYGYVSPAPKPKEELIVLRSDGDIVLNNYKQNDPLSILCWSEGTTCGQRDKSVVADVGDNWKGITAGDFDGDGVVEIAGLHTPGDIRIYSFNGSSMTEEFWSDKGGNVIPDKTYYGITSGDYNDDGIIEIITLGLGDGNEALLSAYQYDGYSMKGVADSSADPDTIFSPKSTGSSSGKKALVASGDFDGDGEVEIGYNIGMFFWAFSLSGKSITSKFLLHDEARNTNWVSMTADDLDGNGFADIILLNSDGRLERYEYKEEVGTEKLIYIGYASPIVNDNNAYTKVVSGDYDGDGNQNVIVLSKNKIRIYDQNLANLNAIDVTDSKLARDIRGADIYDVWCA